MPRKKPCDLCNFEETNVINLPFVFNKDSSIRNNMPIGIFCSAVKEDDTFKLIAKAGRNGVTIGKGCMEIKYCPLCGRKLI